MVAAMLSRRVPGAVPPNAWSRLLDEARAAGRALVDLTEQNPTRTGLVAAGERELAALADRQGALYRPDPRGTREAREAVAAYYAGRGLTVSPEDLVLTAGTSEAYAHLFRLLCDPGDEVLVPAPSYPLLEPLAALEAVSLRRYRLGWDGAWHLDRESLLQSAGPRTRAVVIVQPNHPTGTCLDADDLAVVERLCEDRGLALVSDEVFGDFVWAHAAGPPRAWPSVIAGRSVPTFALHGLSKLCGMPQMKLGWIVLAGPAAARREARSGLEWVADAFLSVGTPVQLALPTLLEASAPFRAGVLERIVRNRALLDRAVAACPALGVLPAVGGWVAVLRLPGTRDDEAWALELLRRGVVVHPGHFYDFAGDGHLVVTLIADPDEFGSGLDRIVNLAADDTR
jgi:hypothetical protein